MPARTSTRAPTRPATWRLPAYGYMTRARTFSRVDLPEPLMPMSPTDSPGRTSRLMSWRAQRKRLELCPRMALRRCSSSSRSSMRRRSARNRFQMWLASMVPLGDIGESRLQSLEQDVRGQEHHGGRDRRDTQELHVGLLAVQDRLPVAVDHPTHRVEGDIEGLEAGRDELVERERHRGGEQAQLDSDLHHTPLVAYPDHNRRHRHSNPHAQKQL